MHGMEGKVMYESDAFRGGSWSFAELRFSGFATPVALSGSTTSITSTCYLIILWEFELSALSSTYCLVIMCYISQHLY